MNRQTLYNKMHGKHGQVPGHPTELIHPGTSQADEAKLAERIKLLGEWGFPVVASDVKRFAKQYLDSLGCKANGGTICQATYGSTPSVKGMG